ncbi:hypothetical protein K7432_013618 [Basidiobolus ranarum]|uniref:Uncharacterized protein n=1 Tax=Basidiobolus ranarum TaxID=34480 RepID=A0ABR2VRK6_9FUNG
MGQGQSDYTVNVAASFTAFLILLAIAITFRSLRARMKTEHSDLDEMRDVERQVWRPTQSLLEDIPPVYTPHSTQSSSTTGLMPIYTRDSLDTTSCISLIDPPPVYHSRPQSLVQTFDVTSSLPLYH